MTDAPFLRSVFWHKWSDTSSHLLRVLAKAVTKFESDVTIVFEDKKINAKSLLNIIGACIKCGSEIELVCEGPDEEAALAHATELIESGLGE